MGNSIVDQTRSHHLREFAEMLKYELAIDVSVENIMDSLQYMQKRGYHIYYHYYNTPVKKK